MKVKIIDMEECAVEFLKEIIGTMPTTGHKFLAGAMLASKAMAIEEALQAFADTDGMVDTDLLRQTIRAGFAASGDKVSFTISDDRIAWLVKPVTVSITTQDVEGMIAAVEKKGAA